MLVLTLEDSFGGNENALSLGITGKITVSVGDIWEACDEGILVSRMALAIGELVDDSISSWIELLGTKNRSMVVQVIGTLYKI